MARFFINFPGKDFRWAKWLAEELKDLGHDAHLTATSPPHWISSAWIERQIHLGHYVICLLSHANIDTMLALERGEQAAGRLSAQMMLFVVVDDRGQCFAIDDLKCCDISGIPADWARQRFRRFIALSVPPGRTDHAQPKRHIEF